MTWNYRVVKRTVNGTVMFEIYEVYYDETGDIEAMSLSSMSPYGEDDVQELRSDLIYMIQAFSKPVLDYDDLLRKLTKDITND